MKMKNEKLSDVLIARCEFVAALLIAISLTSGCTGSNKRTEYTREYLDRLTGVTITALNEPLIMAHSEPSISRSLRDYLYIGPVEVNTMGKRSYYLWIGPFSTIDRPSAELGALALIADGSSTELGIAVTKDAAGLKTEPYNLPLGSGSGRYTPITFELLTKLANTRTIEIEADVDDESRSYALWHGELAALRAFTAALQIPAADNQRLQINSHE